MSAVARLASELAALAAAGDVEGARLMHETIGRLLAPALDRGKEPAHVHYHGLALTPDTEALRRLWSELAGAEARLTRATPVTGWRPLRAEDRERRLAKNLAAVIWYAFRPLPVSQSPRCLTRDVYASGVGVRSFSLTPSVASGMTSPSSCSSHLDTPIAVQHASRILLADAHAS